MKNINFIIGRNPKISNNEIPIKVDDYSKQVGDSHCRIICEGESKKVDGNNFYIENIDSMNGTYVGGVKINSKTKITSRSLITLGKNDIRFSLDNSIIKKTLKNRDKQEFREDLSTPNKQNQKNETEDSIIENNVKSILSMKQKPSNNKNQINKIVNVTLTGGIIGLLGDSPQNSLNKSIKKENENGWKVIQVIPSKSGNILLHILRLIMLICTLFFYTTANGYYVIMEKK